MDTHRSTDEACAEHGAFRRRAIAALDQAVAGDLPGARLAVLDLQVHYGHLTEALLVWADTVIGRTPPAQHPALLTPPDNAADDPVAAWAVKVITARLTNDKEAFATLRLSVPRRREAVEAHAMGLLKVITDHLRAGEAGSAR
ncbi:hypothetical protein [Streptosporangium sp. NPDC051022]|uniref:hypothetical protein n=1 Tax=Streptosporangium sp. NPDC051022 TaxID=3155752 RepID=UPI0034417D55